MLYNVFIKISSQNTSKGCDASNICSFRGVRLLAPLAEINTMPADDLDGSKTLRLDHAIRPLTPIPGSKLGLLGLD